MRKIDSGIVPEGAEKISKNRDIPRPFAIKPPLETKEMGAMDELSGV